MEVLLNLKVNEWRDFLPTNWRALCQFVAGSSVQFAALIHAMKS